MCLDIGQLTPQCLAALKGRPGIRHEGEKPAPPAPASLPYINAGCAGSYNQNPSLTRFLQLKRR